MTREASPKAQKFIKDLLAQRRPEDVDAIREALNAVVFREGYLPAPNASEAIDRLKAIPRAQREAPKVEPGYYVRDEDGAKVVYVVVPSKQNHGRVYAKRLDIDPDTHHARWAYVRGGIYTLEGLTTLTVEEAATLGHLHGVCVVCTKQLTDPASVERGIGPVCAKKLTKEA